MVKYQSRRLDQTFAALADPTRRAILRRLAKGECSVTRLAKPFDMSLPAVSKHLRVLERAGLLAQHKNGRVRRCRLNAKPMREAAKWMAAYREFWTDQLDALVEFLENHESTPRSTSSRLRNRGVTG